MRGSGKNMSRPWTIARSWDEETRGNGREAAYRGFQMVCGEYLHRSLALFIPGKSQADRGTVFLAEIAKPHGFY